MDYYFRLLSDPERLTGSFGFYRARDATLAQNEKRAKTKLTMPVLGIGGADSWGPAVADSFKPVATDVRSTVIPDAGHWLAEQARRVARDPDRVSELPQRRSHIGPAGREVGQG
ncbi:alpha/beta fold hydrolase [Streptomyces pilosus]